MRIRHVLFLFIISITSSIAYAQQPAASPHFREELAKAPTDSQKLIVYRSIYDHYKSVAGDSAMPYVEQGLQEFTHSGYKHGQGAMLLLLSNIYNERGLLVVAREKAELALQLFTELNEEQYSGRAHNSIGNANSYLGNYTEAVKHFLAALKNFEHLQDTSDIINTYLELGAANDFNGNHEQALGYYNKALDLSLRTVETANIVYLYNNIGLNYARKGAFDTALKYFEKAEVLSRKPAYIKTRIHPLLNLGKVYNAKGDNKKALDYLYQALALAKSLNTKEPVSRVLLEIGQIESESTPPNISSLQEGLKVAKEIDSKRLQANFLSALANVADKTGNYKEEVALLKQARVLRDSIFNIDKAKEIANLQSEYELKRTSTQLAALELSEKRNAEKKNIIIIIAVVLTVTLITLMLFYTRSSRLNRELSIREHDLKKANGVKDRLFSIIGHDLKGPIGNIPALLEIYKQDDNTEEEKAHILKSMEESSRASFETLEKLLSWGKQQIKGNVFSPTTLDVTTIMNDMLRLHGVAVENKQITIHNNVAPGTQVYADENHFKFVMRNLVSNAIKFSQPGGDVEIGATQQAGAHQLTFSVKDNGIGIDKAMQQHIFDPSHESTVGTANETGTSIGLMLCKEFVIQNGGNIWVESTKGQGTTFFFTVPYAK